jgi:hypothetical protein
VLPNLWSRNSQTIAEALSFGEDEFVMAEPGAIDGLSTPAT